VAERIEVVVAVIGDPRGYPANGPVLYDVLPEKYWSVPYSARDKVTLQVEPDETLGDVLRRAALHWSTMVGAHVAFYRPEDEGSPPRRMGPVVPLIDEHGRVTFGHYFGDVRYVDLLRSADAGALDGDPRRPYLILQPGIGNGVLPDWHTIQTIWQTVEYVATALATAGGAGAALLGAKKATIDRLRKRAKDTQAVVAEKSEDWVSRNGEPYDFGEWLDDRPWLPAEIAPLLACTEGEAEAVLWAFGFAPSESGLWRKNATEEARLCAETTRLAVQGYTHEASEAELRAVIRDEIEHYLTENEARPFEWERLPWLRPPSPTKDKFMRVLSPLYHARGWLKHDG
jgi:hypothetical protein